MALWNLLLKPLKDCFRNLQLNYKVNFQTFDYHFYVSGVETDFSGQDCDFHIYSLEVAPLTIFATVFLFAFP